MNTMINPNPLARKRPSLEEQINRLDRMLDGLSEGLNEAIADAVKVAVGAAVKEAVQVVLTEVLTNTDLRAQLFVPVAGHAGEPNVAAAKPPQQGRRLADWWQRLRACIVAIHAAYRFSQCRILSAAGRLQNWTRTGFEAGNELVRQFRYPLATALGIGVLLGAAVWYSEPWLGSLISGIGGFATTLALQAGLWIRKALKTNLNPAA